MVTLLTVVLIPKHLTDQQKVNGLVQKNVTSHLFSYDVYIVLMTTATVILISVFFYYRNDGTFEIMSKDYSTVISVC